MADKAPTLDPKLAEVYNRVMGTPLTPAPTAPSAAPKEDHVQAFSQTEKKDEEKGEKKKGVSMPLIVLGIVIFFLVYAYIWTKIFNFQLPFLP